MDETYYTPEWDPLLKHFHAVFGPHLGVLRGGLELSRDQIDALLDAVSRFEDREEQINFLRDIGMTPQKCGDRETHLTRIANLEQVNVDVMARLQTLEEAVNEPPEVQVEEKVNFGLDFDQRTNNVKKDLNDFRYSGPEGHYRPLPRFPNPAPYDPPKPTGPPAPEPKYPAPTAEWNRPTPVQSRGQGTRPGRFDRAKTFVKDYFKGSAPPVQSNPAPPQRRLRRVTYKDLDSFPAPPAWDEGLYDGGLLGQEMHIVDHMRLWEHPKFNRRSVKIRSIQEDLPTEALLAQLPLGHYILKITRRPSPVDHRDDVSLTFLSTADAETFTSTARRSHSTRMLHGLITHENEKTTPVPRKVQAAIYDLELRASRIMVLEAVPVSFYQGDELREQLFEVFENALELILGPPKFYTDATSRNVEIQFCNVGAAIQAWHAFNTKKATSDPLWRMVIISFKKDGTLPKLCIEPDSPSSCSSSSIAASEDFLEPTPDDRGNIGRNEYHTSQTYAAQEGFALHDIKKSEEDTSGNDSSSPAAAASPDANQTDGTQDQADIAAMPAEEGVSGLGISTPAGDQLEEGEIDTTDSSNNGEVNTANDTSQGESSTNAGPSNSAIAGSTQRPSSEPAILIRGNLPVRPGDANAIAIARSMGKSRWAD
ncbi:hypothetical protein HDK77DRAFT_478914 [Phyllosticta capitalensis]